jgi:hypothetical protein
MTVSLCFLNINHEQCRVGNDEQNGSASYLSLNGKKSLQVKYEKKRRMCNGMFAFFFGIEFPYGKMDDSLVHRLADALFYHECTNKMRS